MSLKETIAEAMKQAMRAKDSSRLGVIRLIQAAIKQREVDERVKLDDPEVLATLDKMLKSNREANQQYEDAGRTDLANKGRLEIEVIQSFLPQPLSEEEITTLIADAIKQTGASSMKDMGQVMALLKPKIQGRADLSLVSREIKNILNG